jgi:hypothetical protein
MIVAIQAIFLFAIAFFFSKRENELWKLFWIALSVKIIAGIALGLIYTHYYFAGDTFAYFNDALVVAEYAETNVGGYFDFLWSSDSSTISDLKIKDVRAQHFTKILSLFAVASFRNYWIISVMLSMISFAGSWFLVKTIRAHIPNSFAAAVFAFLFFPSVVFWSSGIIRESISMACLLYLSAVILKVWFGEKITIVQLILIALSAWTLWILKYYFAAVFFAVGSTTVMFHFIWPILKFKFKGADLLIWFLIFLIPTIVVSLSLPNLYPSRVLNVIVDNHNAYLPDNASISFYNLSPTLSSFTLNFPVALISGLFRPFLWESVSILQGVVAVENFGIEIFTIIAVLHLRKTGMREHNVLIIALLVYVFMLAIFITLSTPNFGTLSRYRVGYLPFFIYIVCVVQPSIRFLERMLCRLVRFQS